MKISTYISFDSISKKHFISKAIVVLAVALLLFACSENKTTGDSSKKSGIVSDDSPFLSVENEALAQIKKSVEDKREKDGNNAVRLLVPFRKDMGEGALTQEEYDRIKSQMDLLYVGVGTYLHRHELDLALMQYAVSVADKVRPPLAARIKNGQKIPNNISVYLKETLMADFEQKSAEAIKLDQTEIEFWKAESEKWRKSWESKTYDYVLPPKPRGQFLFDYEAATGNGESSIKSIEESIQKQLKKELGGAIRKDEQQN